MNLEVRNVIVGWKEYHGKVLPAQSYDISQLVLVDYETNGDTIKTISSDPQMFIQDVEGYVEDITIEFAEKIEQRIDISVYYATDGENFSEDKKVSANIEKEEKRIVIPVCKEVKGLRTDIGSEIGISFSFYRLIINEDGSPYSWGSLMDCIYQAVTDSVWFDYVQLYFILFLFISMNLIVEPKKLYAYLFDRRWIVAGLLLLFLVLNRYHGDSIAEYDKYIQSGAGNEYVQPLLGQSRAIRSDEWLVSASQDLSTQFLDNPYGDYNNIIRGTETLNGNVLTLYNVLDPVYLVKTILVETVGIEYAWSFKWYVPFFLGLLFNIELFMIISEGKKLLSFCGACMTIFSSFFLWWGTPAQWIYAPAALVCACYYIIRSGWKEKVLFGWGTAYFTAKFIIIMYPAWQVPMAYVALVILLWMIYTFWGKIKKLSRWEWAGIGLAFILCAVMVIDNLISQRRYNEVIMNTVYPGSRVDYGSNVIVKLYNYVIGVLFPFVDAGNASEKGELLSFFPIPLLMAAYLWFVNKKKDFLTGGLLLVSIPLILYTTIGLPPLVAKITLLTFSVASRAVDILGYINVLLFVIILSRYSRKRKLNTYIGTGVASVVSGIVVYSIYQNVEGYMSAGYGILAFIALTIVFCVILSDTSERSQAGVLTGIIIVSVCSGLCVRPLAKGLDAIYSKPLAAAIQTVTAKDKEAKWLAYGGVVLSAYAVACGAPTLNSVNTYPNMELWRTLDPEGIYNEVYNRYAHIALQFTEETTSMELQQQDLFRLNLSYQDIEKTDAEYVVSVEELEIDNKYVRFERLYGEDGCYIYQIHYQ